MKQNDCISSRHCLSSESRVVKIRKASRVSKRERIVRATTITLAVLIMSASSVSLATNVYADQYSDRIKALHDQVLQYQAQATLLQNQASSLSDAINKITSEKAAIQAQIDIAQITYNHLQQQIDSTQIKIKENQDALGTIIANLYVDDSITPLEMLVSSKNISDYLDKQQYRNSVRDQLTSTIQSIKTLKTQLDQQKVDIEHTLTDSKNASQELISKEAEQTQLLTQTNGQETAYEQLSANKKIEEAQLVKEQIAYNMSAAQKGDSQTLVSDSASGGGYPSSWASAAQDSVIDTWSLFNRECVSYVAWKIASTGRFVPNFSGQGNANQWQTYVAQYGIKSGSTAVVGSAAVLYGGAYGHVMYVEAVSSDKTRITISEYNYNWSGLFSKRSISSAGLTYLYF